MVSPTLKCWKLEPLYICGTNTIPNAKLGNKRGVAYVTWPTFKFWKPSIVSKVLGCEILVVTWPTFRIFGPLYIYGMAEATNFNESKPTTRISLTLADPGGGGNPAMPHHGLMEGLGPPPASAEGIIKGRWIIQISRFIARFACITYVKCRVVENAVRDGNGSAADRAVLDAAVTFMSAKRKE